MFCFLFLAGKSASGRAQQGYLPQERCPVCGMFVAKYPDWITQVRMNNTTVKYFDGVKDMMAFAHNPASFGAAGQTLKEIWVKDYYTLAWLDGRSAWYVIGSDVYGPMGHEFIPSARRGGGKFSQGSQGDQGYPF